MILRKATIKYKGYDPKDLKPKSNKRICCSCDSCGRVRYINKSAYRDICKSCLSKGENNPMFGKKHSKETKQKMCGENHPMYGIHRYGKEAPNWQGGWNRDHTLPKGQCIKLNTKFSNSEFHHITRSIGIFIPYELHRHIWHNLKNGQGMGSMNLLALQFINGEL